MDSPAASVDSPAASEDTPAAGVAGTAADNSAVAPAAAAAQTGHLDSGAAWMTTARGTF